LWKGTRLDTPGLGGWEARSFFPILLTLSNWCEIPPGGLTFAAVETTVVRLFNLLAFSGETSFFHILGFSFEPILIRSIRKFDGWHGLCLQAIR
jgi:hypothetical protein